MRRAIAMTAVAVALGLALTGCRGAGGRDAQSPVRPDTAATVSTPAAPAPQETAPPTRPPPRAGPTRTSPSWTGSWASWTGS
ncbi:hypothetical protein ACFQY4_02030 [Catellatospora bangladeshensis]|uniref:hypothetical protein n=1 Tax=Catellatospora bangladeshensis TaxID=310355 RepID=UPI00361397B4